MFEKDDAYMKNYERLVKIAKNKGYVLNSDKERENKVIGLMVKNSKEYGKYYCPCKQHHPLDTDVDPLCPCDDLEKEIQEDGYCFCKLFFKGGDR